MPSEHGDRRFPAEWEKHEATWIFWPTRPDAYLYGSPDEYHMVLNSFTRLVDVISAFEPVHVVVSEEKHAEAEYWLKQRATLHVIDIDDAWARDAAPTFITTKKGLTALCWKFTGWGGRFSPFEKDAKVAAQIARMIEVPVISSTMGMEGGGIHSNGKGTLMTTDPVLYDKGRNEFSNKSELQDQLKKTLGANELLSLPGVFHGDDTGGHVDVVAAFHPENLVLLNDCSEREDPNYKSTLLNKEYFLAHQWESVAIPQPPATYTGDSRLAYSYLNFYLCNDALIAPSFGLNLDKRVRDQLQELFPNRDVISLEARPFYWGGGGIHCVTQQQPTRSMSL